MEQEIKDKELAVRNAEVLQKANSFEIISHQIYIEATEFTKNVKAMNKNVTETFEPIVSKASQAHKEALSQMKKFTKPLDEAEEILKEKMIGWIKQNEETLDGIPKVEGVSFKKKYAWELSDLTKVDPNFLTIDEKAVNKLVLSLGAGAKDIVGGIEVTDELSVAIRL